MKDETSSSPAEGQQVVSSESPQHRDDRIRWLRSLSMEERGELLVIACRTAALIERSRIASGLPPTEREPWPESTWEFLRKHAPNARKQSESDS